MKHLKMKMPVMSKETFIQDIPQEFSSDLITAAVKTRMKLGNILFNSSLNYKLILLFLA